MADFQTRLEAARKERAQAQAAKKNDKSFWEKVGGVYEGVMKMPTDLAAGLPRFGIGLASDLIETARLPSTVIDAGAERLGAPEWLQDTLVGVNPLNLPANINDWLHGRDPEDQLDKIHTFDSDTNRFSEVVNEVMPNIRGVVWDSPGATGKRAIQSQISSATATAGLLSGDEELRDKGIEGNPYKQAFDEGQLPQVVIEDIANAATVAGLASGAVGAASKAATGAATEAAMVEAARAASRGTATEAAARAVAGAGDDVARGAGATTITEDAARAAARAQQIDDAIQMRVADAPKIEEAAHQVRDINQPGQLEQTLAVSDQASAAAQAVAEARAAGNTGYTGWNPGRAERFVGERLAPYADQLQVVADQLGGFSKTANRVADAPIRLPYEGLKALGRQIDSIAPETGGFVRGTVDAYGAVAAKGAKAFADRAIRRAAQGTIQHAAAAINEPFQRAAKETNDWLESELSPVEQEAIVQGRVSGVAEGASPTTEAWRLARANEDELASRLPEDQQLPWQQRARGAPDAEVLQVMAERDRLRATPAEQLTPDQVSFLERMDEADHRLGLLYDVMQERRQIPYGEHTLPPLEGSEAYDQWRATRTAEAGNAPVPKYVKDELRASEAYQEALALIEQGRKDRLPDRTVAERVYEQTYLEYDAALKELDDLKIRQAQEKGRLKNIAQARRDLEVAQGVADRAADRVRAAYQAADDMATDWKYGQALGRMETTDVRPVPEGVAQDLAARADEGLADPTAVAAAQAGAALYEGTVRPNVPEPQQIPVRINGVDPRLDFPDSIAAAPVEGTPIHDVIPDAQVRVSLAPPEANGSSPVATLALFDDQALAEGTANAVYPAAMFRWDTGTGEILMASTDSRLQRQGVASALLDTADGIAGSIGAARPVHSSDLTDAGRSFASAAAERDMGRAIGNLRGMAEDRPLIGEAADLVARQKQAREMVEFADVNEQGRQYGLEAEADLRRESGRLQKLREQRDKWEEREGVRRAQEAWDNERRLVQDEDAPATPDERTTMVRDMRQQGLEAVAEELGRAKWDLETRTGYEIGSLPKLPPKVRIRDPQTGRITRWAYDVPGGEWDWANTASPETIAAYKWASRKGRGGGLDELMDNWAAGRAGLDSVGADSAATMDEFLTELQFIHDTERFIGNREPYTPGSMRGRLQELEDLGYDPDRLFGDGQGSGYLIDDLMGWADGEVPPAAIDETWTHIRDVDTWMRDRDLQNRIGAVERELAPLVDEQGIPRADLTPDEWELAVDLTDELEQLRTEGQAVEPPPLGSRPELPKGRFRNPGDDELAQAERFRDEAASRLASAQGAFDPDAPSPAEAARSLEAVNAEEQSYLRRIEMESGKVKPKLTKSKDAQLTKEQAAERLFVLEQAGPVPGADAVLAESPTEVFKRVKEAEATLDAVDAVDNAKARAEFIEDAAKTNPENLPPDWRAMLEENQRISKVLRGQQKAFRDLGLDDAADHIDRVLETLPLTIEDAVAAGYEPKHIITGQKGIDAQADLQSQALLDARDRAQRTPSLATKKVGSERMRDSGPFGDRSPQAQIAAMIDRHAVGTRNEAMRGLAERYRGAGDEAVGQLVDDAYAEFSDELAAYELGEADTLPEIDAGPVYDEMRARGFRPVDPSTLKTVKRGEVVLPTQDVLEAGGRPTVWVPEPIQKALEDAQEAARPATTWERRFNKGVAYWKLTVLPLSPKWNIGNIIGNTFMAASTLKPGDLSMRNFLETREAIRNPNQRQARVMKQGLAQVDLGEAFGEIADGAELPRTRTGRALRSIPNASYRVNQYIDDFTHLFIYTAKRNEGIAFRNELFDSLQSGRITPEQFDKMIAEPPKLRDGGKRSWSDERAAQHALDIAGDFTNLTKGERRYIRKVMPFYPWYRHITKLVFRLPLENPYRVAWALHLAEQFGNDDDLPYWLRGATQAGDYFLKGAWNPYPGGTPGESPVLNPVAALGSTTPALQWPLAAFGFNAGRAKPLSMSPASQVYDAEGRATVGKFIGLKNFAGYMTGQIPQARLARDLLSPPVARYDTGEPIKARGRAIPLTGQDFGLQGITAPNPNAWAAGSLREGQIPSSLLSFLTGATIDAPDLAELERLRARRLLENQRAAQAYSR